MRPSSTPQSPFPHAILLLIAEVAEKLDRCRRQERCKFVVALAALEWALIVAHAVSGYLASVYSLKRSSGHSFAVWLGA
ncbi:MAG: hypothetical protein ACP5P1_13935 [Acidimicrobiales bacterium]